MTNSEAKQINKMTARDEALKQICNKNKELKEENDKLKTGIEQLKSNNDKMHRDLKLSVNAQSLVNRLLQEMFSAECYNDEFNGQEVTNLLCLGNVCDVLSEMCDYER